MCVLMVEEAGSLVVIKYTSQVKEVANVAALVDRYLKDPKYLSIRVERLADEE